MTTTWIQFNSWVGMRAEVTVRGATPANPNAFRLILTNGVIITRSMVMADFVSAELNEFGYARRQYLPEQGSWNNAANWYEFPSETLNFGALGGSLQWSAAIVIANSIATPRSVTGVPVMFANFPTQLIGDGATQPIRVDWRFANMGGANGV